MTAQGRKTWSRCIEERLPFGRSCRGELLLARSVSLEVLFAHLQDVLEVLGGILQAQPQAVHNGSRVALALRVSCLCSRREVLEVHQAHIERLDVLLDEIAEPRDLHSGIVKLPCKSHSTLSTRGLCECESCPLHAHAPLRRAPERQCSAAKTGVDSDAHINS